MTKGLALFLNMILTTKEVPDDQWGFLLFFFFNQQESSSYMNLKGGKCNRRAMPSSNNVDELETLLLFLHLKIRGTGTQKPIYSMNVYHA